MAIAGWKSPDFALSRVYGRTAHAHAILRRLSTDRGGLVGSPAYGYNLLSAIGSTDNPTLVSQRVREQCLADERTEDAIVTVTFNTDHTLRVSISLFSADGPFSLVLDAGQELTAQMIIDGNPQFWGRAAT